MTAFAGQCGAPVDRARSAGSGVMGTGKGSFSAPLFLVCPTRDPSNQGRTRCGGIAETTERHGLGRCGAAAHAAPRARSAAATNKAPVIEADNCVFHKLAMKNPEICHFDLAMMGSFTESKVDHQERMTRGGNVCRFKFIPRK
jgi:hypothetical protein